MDDPFSSPETPDTNFPEIPDFYFKTRFRDHQSGCDWPSEFSIITAYATTGLDWPPAENQAADEALKDELKSGNKLITRLTGYSPQTKHAEPGWAATLEWQAACDLGLRYKQDAIYHVMADELFVSYCDDRRKLVPVAVFRERLDPAFETPAP